MRWFREFLFFLKHEKRWWLIPLLALLLGIAALILFSSSSALSPLLYPNQ